MGKLIVEDVLQKYPLKDRFLKDVTSEGPINTLGKLREILKDYPDNTVLSLGLVCMWREGETPPAQGHRVAHRLVQVKEGTLKSGEKYLCLLSGQDITDKVWKHQIFDIDNDTGTGNKKTDD